MNEPQIKILPKYASSQRLDISIQISKPEVLIYCSNREFA